MLDLAPPEFILVLASSTGGKGQGGIQKLLHSGPSRTGAEKTGGSRRIADAAAMGLDVEPDCLFADVADASPTHR
eukprot:4297200-Pyramimonas_sp.AAC.1